MEATLYHRGDLPLDHLAIERIRDSIRAGEWDGIPTGTELVRVIQEPGEPPTVKVVAGARNLEEMRAW